MWRAGQGGGLGGRPAGAAQEGLPQGGVRGEVEAAGEDPELPEHPLVEHGFRSIGCMDCTARGGTGAGPRAGRWAATGKTECGIHLGPDGRFIRTGA
jgi:hypothetical protein